MKTILEGVLYDTETAHPLASVCFSLHGITVEETACRTPEGRCFIVRRIGGQETALVPISDGDLERWRDYRSTFPEQLWPG